MFPAVRKSEAGGRYDGLSVLGIATPFLNHSYVGVPTPLPYATVSESITPPTHIVSVTIGSVVIVGSGLTTMYAVSDVISSQSPLLKFIVHQ